MCDLAVLHHEDVVHLSFTGARRIHGRLDQDGVVRLSPMIRGLERDVTDHFEVTGE